MLLIRTQARLLRSEKRRVFSTTKKLHVAVLENFWEKIEGGGATPHGGYQWFENFHSKAAQKIRARLHQCDVVIEMRDARVPFSSYNSELEKLTSQKPRVVVFNKSDLSDQAANEKLLTFYKKLGVPALLTNFGGLSAKDARRLAVVIQKTRSPTYLKTAPTTCLVVGLPNVGKSSLIHSLRRAFVDELTDAAGYRYAVRKKIANRQMRVTGFAGMTRKIGMISIPIGETSVTLIDTPGFLSPKVSNVRQSEKISVLGLADFTHQQKEAHIEKVGQMVWELCYQSGMEAAVMAHFRMAYPPPASYPEFKKRAVLTLDLLGKAAKYNVTHHLSENTYGHGMFREFERAVNTLVTGFRRGDFGRITLDEVPVIDENSIVQAPSYIQELYYEERKNRRDRENFAKEKMRMELEQRKEQDEKDDKQQQQTEQDPQRIWNIKSRTLDVTGAEHASSPSPTAHYKLDKIVSRLRSGSDPISRHSGALKGDLHEFDTDKLGDIRASQMELRNKKDEEVSRGYAISRSRKFKHLNMHRDEAPQVGNFVRIRNYARPNSLNDRRAINILTGELKMSESMEDRRAKASERFKVGSLL
eukprot:TRINITY_DN3043_c9_g1_i1.p1 TRINITY_DN3043_c9_g1~~TRINITY_DN3043_c9_g1_i1.p1  ORF type:complete len:613 (+),score=98.09 TRINITY_DN3043_c9_g1_i1:80-1840(+)